MKFAQSHSRQLLILLVVAGFGAGVRPAAAQMPTMPSASNPQSLGAGPPNLAPPPSETKKTPAEPPALPGATPRADRVAPSAAVTITDPTEALFDAINRGDIGTARDAIDRGADLGGHDVLGMTPLELSVDLGRNDITFLLLSLRGGDSRPRAARQAQTARTPAATGGKVAAATPAKPTTKAPARPAAAHPATTPVAQQFAGGSGTPDPAAGFLGFGPSR